MDTTTRIWPAANEMGAGWTARYPRPTAQGGHNPALLAFRQKTWDEAEALRVRFAKRAAEIHAEREAELQQERDRRQAETEAKRQQQNAETEALLRRRFLAAGGSDADWEGEKAELVAEHRRRAVAAGDAAEAARRAASAARYR